VCVCVCVLGGGGRNAFTVLVGKLEGKRHLEDLGTGGKIILKWILKKWNGRMWTESAEVRTNGRMLWTRY